MNLHEAIHNKIHTMSAAELQEALYLVRGELRQKIDSLEAAREVAKAIEKKAIDELVKKAHKLANDRDLCSEFDDFMAQLGLPRRTKEFNVDLTVSFNISIAAEGTDEDQIRDDFYNNEFENAIKDAIKSAATFDPAFEVEFDQVWEV